MQWARKKHRNNILLTIEGQVGINILAIIEKKGAFRGEHQCLLRCIHTRVICGRRHRIDKFETLLGAEMTKKMSMKNLLRYECKK